MKGKKRLGQRLLALCSSIALVVGTLSFSVFADAAQSGSSDYIGFDVRYYGFNVYGKSTSSSYMKTTYNNGGYSTFLTVDGQTVYTSDLTPSTPNYTSPIFEFGKDFSVSDASVSVTAAINDSGKGVLLTYTVTNNSDSARTMSVGSCSDCQIDSDDGADVRTYENGLSMTQSNGSGSNVFYLLPVSNEFTSLWSGYYGSRYSNQTGNSSHNYDGDSGLAWSWSVDVPAHGTVTRTCIIACGQVDILTTHTLSFDANGGEGTMASHSFVTDVESTLPACTFTREGYDFLGWSTDANATTATYADQGSISIDADTTLYAIWARHMDASSFTAPTGNDLTYNATAQELITAGSTDNGTMLYSLEADGEFTADIPTATASGTYTVYYMVDGDESHYDSTVESVEATISPLMVPVTVDGEPYLEVSAEETFERPATPSRVGYEFDGWYADEALTTAYDFTQVAGINGVDLYSKWTRVSYSLTEGADPVWISGSSDDLVIRAVRNVNESTTFSHFTGVKVDGYTLDTTAYSAVSGSVIVTISSDYLNTLATGSHTIELTFDDGDPASTTLTIAQAQVLGVQRAQETTAETTTAAAEATATATPTPTTAPSNTVATGETAVSSNVTAGIILILAGAAAGTILISRKRNEVA